ncbi:E3 ubiquitin-protein ligase TRIM21-like [Alosa pseudoharengus]|uniref:E3 ubiquitin-protein ligase TRIM21-like n=1 Tax=Alosa pseudoharengus TaxID=34774 RepID=UPI003F8A3A22
MCGVFPVVAMAFSGAGVIREEQLQCPICLQLLADPVTTSCGHNYCQACLGQYWDKTAHGWRCPLCKEAFAQRPALRINTTLRDMVELFRQGAAHTDAELGPTPGPEGSSPVPRPLALPGEVACDVCGGGGGQWRLRALKSCLDCGTSFCALHLELHQRAPALQRHVLSEPLQDLEGRVCQKHRRPLELFCRDDHTCVCQFCTEGEHKNHSTVPLEEEGKDRKTKLGKTQAELLEMILERLDKISEIKHSVELRKASIQNIHTDTHTNISHTHTHLTYTHTQRSTEEELAASEQLCASVMRCVERSRQELEEDLREDQEAAEREAEEMVAQLQQEITSLKTRSTDTVHLLHTEDNLHLLQADPALCCPPETCSWAGVRVNTHVCVEAAMVKMEKTLRDQLQSIPQRKLRRIQQYEVDVTLDPVTAHPKLLLSADRKEVRCGDKPQKVPPSPLRFDSCACVLATQRFASGRHYFQVRVGGKTGWGVGVASEVLQRKGEVCVSPEEGVWTLVLRAGAGAGPEYWAADHTPQRLTPCGELRTLGVFLDYDGGRVEFYDVENAALLYAFAHLTFTDRLHPFFSPYNNDGGGNSAPLVITPVNHTT